MKKAILIVLSLAMVLSLAACGAAQQPAEPATTAAAAETTAPAGETTGATETTAAADPKETAMSYIDKPVSELIAVIGEPQSSDYAPSCLNPGQGEDGMLYYDGFVVYTYKEGDVETVEDVE